MNTVMNFFFFLRFQWGVTDVTDRQACDVGCLVYISHSKELKVVGHGWVLRYIII